MAIAIPNYDSGSRRQSLEDESTKDLVRDFLEEGRRLLREEARLVRLELQTVADEGRQRIERDLATAKKELTAEAKKAARAGSTLGAGGILAHAALYLALFTAVFVLANFVPLWAAGLIVTGVVGAVAAFLILTGIKGLKDVQLAPQKTLHQLQEDKQWMRDRAHALKSTIRANA